MECPLLAAVARSGNSGRLFHHKLPHSAYYRLWGFRLQLHRSILILTGVNSCSCLQQSESLSFFLWDAQMHAADPVFIDHGVDLRKQFG